MILTKSLSRFARNTLDSLTIIKQLREKNIEINFEKENISSLDTSIDFIISVLSGMAEAESKQVSDNCYWTINKRYQEGNLDITHLFCYDITEDRELVINPYQAKAVKQIFNMYLDDKTIPEIIKWLEINNYKTIRGKSKWSRSTIKGMLRQEKYVGDAVLQKRCRVKIGSNPSVINNGIKTKFKINNNHQGIISRKEKWIKGMQSSIRIKSLLINHIIINMCIHQLFINICRRKQIIRMVFVMKY